MPFPTSIAYAPAPGVEGDFCDSNPRFTVNAGPGGLVAGPGGVLMGRFAWVGAPNDADGAPATVLNSGSGAPAGFVRRSVGQGLITAFLAENGMRLQPGTPMTVFKGGGFWARNAGATTAAKGMIAYANNTDGSVSFAAAGSTVAGSTATKWIAQCAGATGEVVKISSQPEG